jgi:hypothetical protein
MRSWVSVGNRRSDPHDHVRLGTPQGRTRVYRVRPFSARQVCIVGCLWNCAGLTRAARLANNPRRKMLPQRRAAGEICQIHRGKHHRDTDSERWMQFVFLKASVKTIASKSVAHMLRNSILLWTPSGKSRRTTTFGSIHSVAKSIRRLW